MTFNVAVTKARKRFFPDQFMEDQYKVQAGFSMGKDMPTPKLGYPDMGAGLFAKRLPYAQWHEFNVI
jgi:hypothetical protein